MFNNIENDRVLDSVPGESVRKTALMDLEVGTPQTRLRGIVQCTIVLAAKDRKIKTAGTVLAYLY